MICHLSNNRGFDWAQLGSCWVKGYFFIEDVFYDAKRGVSFFNSIQTVNNFKAILPKLNGCFAIICQLENHWIAAVDPVRSIPLFYWQNENGSWCISDTIDADQVQSRSLDSIALTEFRLARATPFEKTLFQGVYQLQPAHYAKFSMDGWSQTRYLSHSRNEGAPPACTATALNAVMMDVFERLNTSTLGRPIGVPLSGGYDSRLIAAYLKKLGRKDVYLYTFGRSESYEVHTAKRVADRLGYPWYFVDYGAVDWSEVFKDHAYFLYASNFVSIPFIQDFPAIQFLKATNAIPDNLIIVPGYCGDIFGGSQIPGDIKRGRFKLGPDPVGRLLSGVHHISYPVSDQDFSQLRAYWVEKIGPIDAVDPTRFVSYLESIFTESKVAKVVLNNLRVCEYFGYEWRLPLWDRGLTDYFYQVPLLDRLELPWYERFLFNHVFKPMGIDFRKPGDSDLERHLKYLINRYVPDGAYEWIRERYIRMLNRRSDNQDINAMDRACKTIVTDSNTDIHINLTRYFERQFLSDQLAKCGGD